MEHILVIFIPGLAIFLIILAVLAIQSISRYLVSWLNRTQ